MMKAESIALEDLDEAQVLRLVAETGWIRRRVAYAAFIARRFVRSLIDQGIGKPPLPPMVEETAKTEPRRNYEAYLRRQRSLSEGTILECWRYADRFLTFHFRR